MLIKEVTAPDIADRLLQRGLGFRFGPYEFRVRSDIPVIADAVHTIQAHRELRDPVALPDFTLDFQAGRERLHRAIICSIDGVIWQTWPMRLSVAAMEWITSWCFFRQSYQQLAIHAAAAVLPGSNQVVIFPGDSGAGKSTLASTLMLSGWKLLSDETALLDMDDHHVHALGRPTILKGRSLDLIRSRFGERAVFGPTAKILDPPSSIAHLRPTEESVAIAGQTFPLGAIVLPDRCDDASIGCKLERMPVDEVFIKLTQLGINFRMMGRRGFDEVIQLARQTPGFRLKYHDATEAEQFLRGHELLNVQSAPRPERLSTELCSHEAEPKSRERKAAGAAGHGASSTAFPADINTRVLVTERSPIEVLGLVNQLREDSSVCFDWDLATWDRVIRFANHTALLSQIAVDLEKRDDFARLPIQVRRRIDRQNWLTRFNHRSIEYETDAIARVLAPLNVPLVLLKGSAYLAAKCDWAAGRTTSDIDLLVHPKHLDAVDDSLRKNDFAPMEDNSDRDEQYYRRWLHELAPRRHVYRRIEIDLHFRLLPIGDPYSFPVDEMIERAVPIGGTPFSWLDPVDRIIHSAVNLGHTGEYRRACRDLWDLRYLVESPEDGKPFDWRELSERSKHHGLTRTVGNVLALADELVGLALPEGWIKETTGVSLDAVRRRRLYRLMRTASLPDGRAYRSRRRRTAIWFLEHYPLPKIQTWLDPLTWTKRVKFIQGG
ncbi:hypothetical protein CKO51_25750 [Rhodopirellula sp. SM50]|nr:nucleotidyltransferase family protein [Rhodopirellula sp. SM50]PAY16583.1 hypothetical protein CKO51_25750 [Rhodopirellula sp. SM50]